MNCPYCKRPVPDKIRLPDRVTSELPIFITGKLIFAEPGIYTAEYNPQGAIHIVLDDGTKLGIKPGEYEFVWE